MQFCMNFNHLGMVLIPYHKCMHIIIHFNLGAKWLFFHTFLCCSTLSQGSLLLATHNQQHCQLHFKNSFDNAFCHFHTTNFASVEQSHPCSHMWFIRCLLKYEIISFGARVVTMSRCSSQHDKHIWMQTHPCVVLV